MKALTIVGLAFISFIFGACATIDEPAYSIIPGKAVITKITDSNYDPDGTKSYAEVYFDFIPGNNKAQETYRFRDISDQNQKLYIKKFCAIKKSFLNMKGIETGKIFTAARMELLKTGFSPVFFTVDIDIN